MTLRVLVADDDDFVRKLTLRLLGSQEGIEVVGEATTAEQAVQMAVELAPDIALLDVNMPGGGPAAARGISELAAGTVSVAYSASADSAVAEMAAAGVSNYVLKGTPADEIAARLRAAVSGPAA